ncbi:hypothetical protein [Bradyrhizobium sp. CCBAU 45394]|nr:hypothetical protein [Bradyrhizobium sp. CCBAU 45394]
MTTALELRNAGYKVLVRAGVQRPPRRAELDAPWRRCLC